MCTEPHPHPMESFTYYPCFSNAHAIALAGLGLTLPASASELPCFDSHFRHFLTSSKDIVGLRGAQYSIFSLYFFFLSEKETTEPPLQLSEVFILGFQMDTPVSLCEYVLMSSSINGVTGSCELHHVGAGTELGSSGRAVDFPIC